MATTEVTANLKARNDIATVQDTLEKMKSQFAAALPDHIKPERMIRVALTAIQNTPKLLDCDRNSFLLAVLRAAQLGLEPDGVLGQAYLIPYGNKVQLIPGYKGLIDLARRSGEVSNIIAKEVYENDEFEVDYSQEMPFTHRPLLTGERGKLTHFWAMARFKDGGFHWDYMSLQEVEAVRDKNGKGNAVWKDYFVEMGKKTVIRRIAKYLPMSVQRATIQEDLMDAGRKFNVNDFGDIVIENDEVATTKGTDATKAALTARKEQAAGVTIDQTTGEIINANSVAASSTIRQGTDGREPVPETPEQRTLRAAAEEGLLPGAGKALGDPLAARKAKGQQLLDDLQAMEPEERDDRMATAGGQNFLMELSKDGQYDLVKLIKKAAGIS